MEIESELIRICDEFGQTIKGLTHEDQPVMGNRLLLTLSKLESTFGAKREFVRPEKGYMPGGKYYQDSADLRAMYRRWGVLAASSFGSWQIMFQVAREMGFTGHPIDLQKDAVCCYWATTLINKRFIQRLKAKTLRDVLDAYNSGNHADKYIPTVYIADGIEVYNDLKGV
jgi:hypothetical protein